MCTNWTDVAHELAPAIMVVGCAFAIASVIKVLVVSRLAKRFSHRF